MAYQIGTATNYRDLLDKLRLFLTTDATLTGLGQNWTQMRWNTTSTTQELILKAPGLAGTDEIYVGISSDENVGDDWYNWHLNGYTAYDSLGGFLTQLGSIGNSLPNIPCLNLWNSTIPYWFVADGRRCNIVVRINTRYYSAYLGLLTPYATPAQNPYPLAVMGNNPAYYATRWSSVDSGRIIYRMVNATTWSSGADGAPYTSSIILPADGDVYTLTPISVQAIQSLSSPTRYSGRFFGELEGFFVCSGLNNVSENLINYGGADHLVIQNGSSTSLHNYWAMKLA